MSAPMFSFGGIASGLDTESIIHQLMQVERAPVRRYMHRQAQLRAIDGAWSEVVTKLSSLRSEVDGLRRPTSFDDLVTATSSDLDAVSVTATSTTSPSSTSFTVVQLAAAHKVAAGGTFASGDDLVGTGTFELQAADGTSLLSVTTDGSTTLRGLAEEITASGTHRGEVVKVADGQYRLVVTAVDTGAASTFDVVSDLPSLSTTEVLTTGADAHLQMGTLDIHRSTNTITDLVDGATIQLERPTSTAVTVEVARDVDGAVERIRGFVDGLNELLGVAEELSAYDAEADRAGPLQGDSTLRRLVMDLRSAVSSAVSGLAGDLTHGAAVGIELTREGRVTLDETKLRDALSADFGGVQRLLSRGGTATDARVSFVTATSSTHAGTYAVEITAAAERATAVGATYVAPAAPVTMTITTTGGTEVTATVQPEDADAPAAAARINDALSAAGVTSVRARAVDGAVVVEEERYGSAHGFTVAGSGDLGLDGTHLGADVQGTIGGLAATGSGTGLTGAEGAVSGLVLQIAATADEVTAAGGALALGDVTVTDGLAGAVDRELRLAEGPDGSVSRARDALKSRIRDIDDRIATFEARLEAREVTLRRRFSGLESALARLQSQSAWLASQLSTLSGPSS